MDSIKPPSSLHRTFIFSSEHISESLNTPISFQNQLSIVRFAAAQTRMLAAQQIQISPREQNAPIRRGSLRRASISECEEFQALLKKNQEFLVRKSSEDDSSDPNVPCINPSRFKIIEQ